MASKEDLPASTPAAVARLGDPIRLHKVLRQANSVYFDCHYSRFDRRACPGPTIGAKFAKTSLMQAEAPGLARQVGRVTPATRAADPLLFGPLLSACETAIQAQADPHSQFQIRR
jgi:hypothetical protein